METTSFVNTLICFGSFVFSIAFILLVSSIRIVPEYARFVVFRLGNFVGIRGPGLVLAIPFIERVVIVYVNEQMRDVTINTTTKDGIPVKIEMTFKFKVNDPYTVSTEQQTEKTIADIVVQETESEVRYLSGKEILDIVRMNVDLKERQHIIMGKLHGMEITSIEIRKVNLETTQTL